MMLLNHIKIAWRNLTRGRFSTFINIFGLALGMATTLFILLWVQNEWSYDSYHANAEQIYRIHSHIKISEDETWHWGTSPLLLGDLATEELPEVEAAAKLTMPWGGKTFELNGELFKEKEVAYVSENWFDLFDYEFVEGSAANFTQHVHSIILTQSKAEKFFGTGSALGKSITIDTTAFIVRGIVVDNPSNSTFQFSVLMPLSAHLENPATYENDASWNNFNYTNFLKLDNQADIDQVGEKVTSTLRANKAEDSTSYVSLLPLTAMHFDNSLQSDEFQHGDATTAKVFSIIGLLILLIACINYVSLTTAKASIRAKEISVKKIIGAGKSSLFSQFMVESVMTSLIAMGIALVMVNLLLPSFNQIVEQQFTFNFSNPAIWIVLLGTTVLSILLTGIYPAFLLSSFKPIQLLRGVNWLGGNNSGFRKSLVVVQFVISISLIISVIVIAQQLNFIKNTDLGYERESVFSISIPWNFAPQEQLIGIRNVVRNKLLAQSSIDQIAMANGSIVEARGTHSGSLDWEGRNPDFHPTVAQLSVDNEFQDVFDLKMTEGRWFEQANKADISNVILNETAVKTFNLKPPYVGQRFSFHGNDGQIIGVVKDFHFRSLREKIMPMVIYNEEMSRSQIFIKTTGDRIPDALANARTIWQETLPKQPFEYVFLDESFEKLYRSEQRTGLLFNLFASVAFIISCLGLFGLAAFATERRIKEIGIRKVLGASVTGILGLISKDFLLLVVVALLIASPLAWYVLQQWLEGFAYRIDIKWWVFALAGVAALSIAFLTVSFQSMKAALANPVESLRSE